MAFILREDNVTGTILLQTTSAVDGLLPTIFFTNDSFKGNDQELWVKNNKINGDGSFKHNYGSEDLEFPVTCILTGSQRNANLQVLRDLKDKIIYLDASDIDDNLTDTYIINNNSFEYVEEKVTVNSRILFNMNWEKY